MEGESDEQMEDELESRSDCHLTYTPCYGALQVTLYYYYYYYYTELSSNKL